MEKYKDGNSVKLVVRSDDEKLINVSKKFLTDIEEKFVNFKENYNKELKKLSGYLDNKDYVFMPEKLSKKSPLTLINAPWGTGKTYFVENFIKLFIDKEIESDVFKKIIIIDAWKFSNSTDVPMEFAAELSSILVDIQTDVQDLETKKSLIKKLFGWMNPRNLKLRVGFKIAGFIDIYTETERMTEKETKEVKDNWKLIENNSDSTIIFVDNIERLGSYTWDLLKSIIKLQEFNNYLIVLPLNIDKLSNHNIASNNSEYPIEKYIDFNYYNFIQDYDGFFNTYIKNDEEWVNKLNFIFNTEVNSKKLSIRELESLFQRYHIFDIESKYKQLTEINKNIWPAGESINNVIMQDIEKYFQHHKSICEVVIKAVKELKAKDVNQRFINFPDQDFPNQLFNYEGDDRRYWYSKDKNYIEIFKDINNELEKTSKFYNSEIKKYNDEIKKINENTAKFSKDLNDAKIKAEEYKRLKSEFEIASKSATSNYDEKSHVENNEKLKLILSRIEVIEKEIEKSQNQLDSDMKTIELIKSNMSSQLQNINIFIDEIKKIEAEYSLRDYQILSIDKFIDSVIPNPDRLNDEKFVLPDGIDINKFWDII
jgi:hypothetical protein